MNKEIKTALIIGGVILSVLVILPVVLGAISGWQGYGYGMMGPGMMGGFGGMWFMPIVAILFWGVIIWGIIALIRGAGWSGYSGSSSTSPDSALEILKKRYARGDISKEEFEERKKELL